MRALFSHFALAASVNFPFQEGSVCFPSPSLESNIRLYSRALPHGSLSPISHFLHTRSQNISVAGRVCGSCCSQLVREGENWGRKRKARDLKDKGLFRQRNLLPRACGSTPAVCWRLFCFVFVRVNPVTPCLFSPVSLVQLSNPACSISTHTPCKRHLSWK